MKFANVYTISTRKSVTFAIKLQHGITNFKHKSHVCILFYVIWHFITVNFQPLVFVTVNFQQLYWSSSVIFEKCECWWVHTVVSQLSSICEKHNMQVDMLAFV